MSPHDSHSSFIQTPQQLIVVVLLSFIVPIIGILLIVHVVVTNSNRDPAGLKPEVIAQRIQPVGQVEFGAGGGAAAGSRTGEQIVKATCATCHPAGVANAPKPGDKAAWAPRMKLGMDAMVQSVVKGKGAMPPKAGNAALTEDEIKAAVDYLVASAK